MLQGTFSNYMTMVDGIYFPPRSREDWAETLKIRVLSIHLAKFKDTRDTYKQPLKSESISSNS